MNTGRSIRMLQAKTGITCKQMAYDMEMSKEMISIHRNNESMNGKTMIAFADYFGIPCWEFIKIGEEE